jgi:hypothetical protein
MILCVKLGIAAVLSVGALSACSGHASNGASPKTSAPSSLAVSSTASAATSSVVATPTAKPISYYTAQFTRMSSAYLAAEAKFRSLPPDTSNHDAQTQATALVKNLQATNAALLRADWPANIKADIRAVVISDGPVVGDLYDLVDNANKVVADSGPANVAYNLVLADLGLPPAS